MTVRGSGTGGRSQQLCLSFLAESGFSAEGMLLSAGSDGIDGNSDAAGAVVDGRTVPGARSLGLDPQAFLDENDSYRFFEQAGGLIKTGPTGTNVMDLQIILIE